MKRGEVGFWYQPNTAMGFAPKKSGDVGHDLLSAIEFDEMTRIERLVAKIAKVKVPMVILWPFSLRSIRTEMHLVMGKSMWCEIVSRSSAAQRSIMVIGGIIDSGYIGELYTVIHNVGFRPRIIKRGERYSQVIFHEAVRPTTTQLGARRFKELAKTRERGIAGFGSTGV